MISYIKGKIAYKGESFIIVECHNIGYKIIVSTLTLTKLQQSEDITIYTFMNVKEDNISLFGFLTQQEQYLFHKLLSVSGIGPKGAMAFLSEMTPDEIVLAILSEDIKTLSKAQGIGKKTVQRLILELKDKLKTEEIAEQQIFENQIQQKQCNEKWEAIEGLTSLGYSRSEAMRAVNACYKEGLSVEEILKLSLKNLTKF
ncbi:Holliday junction branch migration protein RuvA [Lachnospiraceae bacterium 46-61]